MKVIVFYIDGTSFEFYNIIKIDYSQNLNYNREKTITEKWVVLFGNNRKTFMINSDNVKHISLDE